MQLPHSFNKLSDESSFDYGKTIDLNLVATHCPPRKKLQTHDAEKKQQQYVPMLVNHSQMANFEKAVKRTSLVLEKDLLEESSITLQRFTHE